ncbi:hypothetical protein C0583_05610 [Candidatus Parcubacteria bacterium]|nr:MAG: hypothetical protein C0583_05610 [Candidatus Parcubacteria bacterium]
MNYKKYFSDNNLIENKNIPNSVWLDYVKNGIYPVRGLVFFYFFILILMLSFFIIPSLNIYQKIKIEFLGDDFTLFVYIAISSLLFLILFFKYFNKKGDYWRKVPINNWFRSWRIYNFLEYLEKENISNIGLFDKQKNIFQINSFKNTGVITIDYIIDLGLLATADRKSPINYTFRTNKEVEAGYEYSHFFKLSFESYIFRKLKNTIYFYGNNRSTFSRYLFLETIKDKGNVFLKNDDENTGVNKLLYDIKKLIQDYPNLKGEILIDNTSVVVKFYDNYRHFTMLNTDGKQYFDFLKNKNNLFESFEGCEKLLNILS